MTEFNDFGIKRQAELRLDYLVGLLQIEIDRLNLFADAFREFEFSRFLTESSGNACYVRKIRAELWAIQNLVKARKMTPQVAEQKLARLRAFGGQIEKGQPA